MIARLAAIALLAVSLGGCMQTLTGSIAGGESKVFERPPYVVLGKTKYDQSVVDNWVEGGVAAYGWKRPAPRPASFDAPRAGAKVVKTAPKKKPGFVKRIRDRIMPAKPDFPTFATPVMPTPQPPVPAPKPRSAIDELLGVRP